MSRAIIYPQITMRLENVDRKFALAGLIYAVVGMILGIVMAASKNHGQMVTHAHIMLLGFVVSFIYALCHKLWLSNSDGTLGQIQFWLHQLGAAILVVGLFLLYGGLVGIDKLDPILAIASTVVLTAMILMVVMFGKSSANS